MSKLISYVRVSSEGQAKEGVSLEAQEGKARAWATLNDFTDVQVFVDAGLSGGRADNRPALQQALAAIGNGDVLLVYSLSRLARSVKDTIEIAELLNKRGANLVSLSESIDTTTAAGKMVFRLLAVMAEFERDLVSERTTMALSHKKSKGEYVGEAPYGKALAEDKIHLVDNEKEIAAVRFIVGLRDSGLSMRKIGAAAIAAGHLPRNGNVWHAQTIKNILEKNK